MKRCALLLGILLPFFGISQENPLERIILEDDSLRIIATNPDHQVQIIYTRIDRDRMNTPGFKTYTFGLDSNLYFYPASTVKMPTAAMALEKLNQLRIKGLDRADQMQVGAVTSPQTPVLGDASSANRLASIEHYIKKIFLVSDNDAYNRLYEFLGQAYLNKALKAKGFTQTRIIHRLSVSGYDTIGNRLTNPVSLYHDGELAYFQNEVYSTFYPKLNLRNQIRGLGYMDSDDKLMAEPFDFRYKNYVSLSDLHDMLKVILFPESVAPHQRFELTEDDYRFLYQYMQMWPRESEYPAYPEFSQWDTYVKFLYYGSKKGQKGGPVRLLNKVGDAYGFLTDIAYIMNPETGTEFLLAATIHTNANQVFNDGIYEYDSIGFPFLQRLGELIYQFDENRPRRRKADLSKFE
ncbi:MAG: serine hydrolase [Saprospiraceae bacterium]|nr:serine hydrolase [Saprospiraceae bacterium]